MAEVQIFDLVVEKELNKRYKSFVKISNAADLHPNIQVEYELNESDFKVYVALTSMLKIINCFGLSLLIETKFGEIKINHGEIAKVDLRGIYGIAHEDVVRLYIQ